MLVVDVYHFGGILKHGYGTDKPRNMIMANLAFEPMTIGFWHV